MLELVTYLLRLLFEGAVGGLGFVLACRLYAAVCMKPKAATKANRLAEKTQAWVLGFKLMVAMIVFSLAVKGGIMQTVSKNSASHTLIPGAVLCLFMTGVVAAHFYPLRRKGLLFL